MSDPATTLLENDHRKWIFPLRTPLMFAKTDANALRAQVARILDPKQFDGFVAGHLAYSRKDTHHLRRVQVLDPFATFFLYDFVHAHRKSFPRSVNLDRHVYGHCFQKDRFVDAFAEYHSFRRKKYELISAHGHFAQLDIFNCFNSFYHHDVTSFVSRRTTPQAGENFGQFLRELNAGVSVACFPQGMYPAKLLGNSYLSLIEESRSLKAPSLARFLDDVVIAASSRRDVDTQVLEVQYILDKHHLALNESKTLIGEKGQRFRERHLDSIKRELLLKREAAKTTYDTEEVGATSEADDEEGLSEEQREYLTSLVRATNVAQEDIELALTLLRGEPDGERMLVDPVLDNAPHLLRSFHRFMELSKSDGTDVWDAITLRLRSGRQVPEHDLFWYARILIDRYAFDQDVADLLLDIYARSASSAVVRAAILETEHLEHGFSDLKESALRAEGTLLIVAAAMVGLAKQDKAKRNHTFKYVARNGANAASLVHIAGRMAG